VNDRKTFSDLRADAGLSVGPSGPHEEILRQACARLLHIDDFLRIDTYRTFLSEAQPPDLALLSLRERLLARMLVASYVKHESELPMAVTSRLDHSMPGDLFAQFAAAVA
jgi:hypothetical protein